MRFDSKFINRAVQSSLIDLAGSNYYIREKFVVLNWHSIARTQKLHQQANWDKYLIDRVTVWLHSDG